MPIILIEGERKNLRRRDWLLNVRKKPMSRIFKTGLRPSKALKKKRDKTRQLHKKEERRKLTEMMKRRKASVMIMLSLIVGGVFISVTAGSVQGAQVSPQVAVKDEVTFLGIEEQSDTPQHHNFTIQQNFFVKCKNGTYVWVQNVYEVWYDSDPCKAIHVRQHWEMWDVPPGTLPTGEGYFDPNENWQTIPGPPFDLELDSYITGAKLNMGGLQAGQPGQAVIDVGPGAEIVSDPADPGARDNWWTSSNTRPEFVLVGPSGEADSQGHVNYPWGELATWTQGTEGYVVPYRALGYKGNGTPDYKIDRNFDLIGHGNNQTGEQSGHMTWFLGPITGLPNFSYTPNNSHDSGIASYAQVSWGGISIPINKFDLLAPYIGLASTILAATVASTVYVKRVKRRKEKQ